MRTKTQKKLFLGIDPGVNGAVATVDENGKLVGWERNDVHLVELADWISERKQNIVFCLIENVHSMPMQGVVSTFTFGVSYGSLLGIIAALQIPFERVAPGVWQRSMHCLTKGDKNVTKNKAIELFPYMKVVHRNAEAMLIAEYCRRVAIDRELF